MDIMGNEVAGSGDGELRPLHVLIAGAGIGGISAAIALRRAGHTVEIFESSRFATETGAAIHLPPNVSGLLRKFGMITKDHGAVNCEWVSQYTPTGEQVFLRETQPLKAAFPHAWQLIHRVDLHSALKDIAVSTDGPGKPVVIHLKSRIASVDPQTPSLTTVDGETHVGDLVIGADGIHSAVRKFVLGEEKQPQPCHTSTFRFLIPSKQVRDDPKTQHFVERKGELRMFFAPDRKIIMYPCRNNEELNFVCMHPDEESDASTDGWDQSASKDLLLNCFKSFSEDMRILLSKINPEQIKVWKLLDFEEFGKGSWVRGRAVLLGDAAHPFLPHQGQGGAQAIEDGAALGALLPLGTLTSDLDRRLELYTEARYDRATMIQDFTRQTAHPGLRSKDGSVVDPMRFTSINFDHDAFDYASGLLNRELCRESRYRRMPLSFGPTRSPRQGLDGRPSNMGKPTSKTTYITFRTIKSYLSSLLPSQEYMIDSQSGWATATFSTTKLGNLAWLGGRGYNHFGLYIHDVVKNKASEIQENQNGVKKEMRGDFLPILFENMADPIITGREELGFAKVFATLEETSTSETNYQLEAGWEGTKFCSMKLSGLKEKDASLSVASPAILSHKVIPSSVELGTADAEYTTMCLQPPAGEQRQWSAEKAEIQFTESVGQDLRMAFPTLANIIAGLRKIEVVEVLESGVKLEV